MDQHDVARRKAVQDNHVAGSGLPGIAIGPRVCRLQDDLLADVPGQRLLIVDDDRDSAELLGELLQRGAYVVRTAFDGAVAMRIAAEFVPDAALLDIGLPIMNGYEVARSLRAIPGLENLKLVAVTGYARPSDERRAREAGFDAHVVKPYHVSTLGPMLRRLLRSQLR